MPRQRTVLGLAALLGGGLSVALVQPTGAMELPPTPTVTVPTVTVTTPTLPPPPPPPTVTVTAPTVPPPPPPTATVPVPAPPPPVQSQPPSLTTTSVGEAVAPRRTTTSSSASAPGPGSAAPPSSSASASSPGGGAGTTDDRSPQADRRERTQARRLAAHAERTANRVAVRLEFVLPAPKRLFLIVRGPAPSCRVVGVVPVRGRAGENVVRFGGRVAGRPLERGIYLLTISPRRRVVTQAPTEAVRVVSPRRTVPLPDTAREPDCPAEQALASEAIARVLLLESRRVAEAANGPSAGSLGARSGPTAPLRPPTVTPPTGSPQDGLPEATPFPGVLTPADGAEGSGAAATIAALAVVGLLLLAMAVLVTRFLRGSWNP